MSRRVLLCDIGKVVVDFDDNRALRQLAQLAGLQVEIGAAFPASVSSLIQGTIWAGFCAGQVTDEGYRETVRLRLSLPGEVTDEQIDLAVADVFTPMLGTIALLENLREREFTLVALSNAEPPRVRRLEHMGVWDLFDDRVVSCEVQLTKPSHDIYRHALGVARAKASEVMFVDDMLPNVLAAAELGIAAHHFQDTDGLIRFLKLHGHHF